MLEWVVLLGNGNYSTLSLLTNLAVSKYFCELLMAKRCVHLFSSSASWFGSVKQPTSAKKRPVQLSGPNCSSQRRNLCSWVGGGGQCDTGSNHRALSPALSGTAASGTAEALNQAELWREDVAVHSLAYRLTWWETVFSLVGTMRWLRSQVSPSRRCGTKSRLHSVWEDDIHPAGRLSRSHREGREVLLHLTDWKWRRWRRLEKC